MKEHPCLSPDQLLEARALPADDPQHAHLASCARCQASLHSLQSFLDDESVPAGARPDLAKPQLSAAIARMTGSQRKSRLPGVWTTGALALAAVLVLVAVLPGTRDQIPTPSQVLRGNAAAEALALTSAINAQGVRVLTWTEVPEADQHVLVFYDATLQEVARVETGDQTRWLFPDPADGRVFWQVTALRGNEVLAVSDPALLRP